MMLLTVYLQARFTTFKECFFSPSDNCVCMHVCVWACERVCSGEQTLMILTIFCQFYLFLADKNIFPSIPGNNKAFFVCIFAFKNIQYVLLIYVFKYHKNLKGEHYYCARTLKKSIWKNFKYSVLLRVFPRHYCLLWVEPCVSVRQRETTLFVTDIIYTYLRWIQLNWMAWHGMECEAGPANAFHTDTV